ncbi:peptidoglycan DD-metalloendopeptidase family protein [Streptomyces sp. NPDC006798]|uniref:peptidoglycan DD-metalloendopeptidase family protein n=1 Tax=Streptomyces sp. NPDC006798 TaxID=3155462 RepID=UPI003408958D
MCQRRRSPWLVLVVIWSVLLSSAPAAARVTGTTGATGATGAAGAAGAASRSDGASVVADPAPDAGQGSGYGADTGPGTPAPMPVPGMPAGLGSGFGAVPSRSSAAPVALLSPGGGPRTRTEARGEGEAEGRSPGDPESDSGGRDPGAAPDRGRAAAHGPVAGTTAEVARLFDEAARVTASYERSTRETGLRRAAAVRLQEQLGRRRTELAALRDAVGAAARDQYRTGGQLTATAGLLLARDPDALMYGRRIARQAETAVERLLARTEEAERRLTSAEDRARRAWRDLELRTARLARSKERLETRLAAARRILQGEAQSRPARGTCPGPARFPAAPGSDIRSSGDGRTGIGTGAGAGTGSAGSGGRETWVAPVDRYRLSAGFGSGGARWANRHTGQDFAVDTGTPVRSVGAGRVLTVSCGGAFGIQIVVQHPGGYYTQYAHLSSAGVVGGEPVRAGQVIGLAGSTGNSTGPHLHFEVRITPYLGSGVDPAAWLRSRGVRLQP